MRRVYGGVLDEPGAFPRAPKKAPSECGSRDRDTHGTWWCDKNNQQWYDGGVKPGNDAFLRLVRYQGGPKGPVMLAAGFGMSSHSFLTRTIGKNLTEFLTGEGYDVWLFDYRAGIDLPSAGTEFSIDDIARDDWPTAIRKVLEVTGRDSVQVFGHCVGSVSLQMTMLHRPLPIRSAVCAQFPLHPVTSAFNWVKSELRVANALDSAGIKVVRPDTISSPANALLYTVLRTLPIPAEERCGQAVCRWINSIYGCTHRHAQLNDRTHRALNEMFGVGNIRSIKHLALMMRKSLAVTEQGGKGYFADPGNMAEVKLLLLQGRHNYIFRPAGTLRTLRWLRAHNPNGQYQRLVLPGYAHLDAIIGARAATEVYPDIVRFLDETQ